MAGRMTRREEEAMPLRIVTDDATPPDDPPKALPERVAAPFAGRGVTALGIVSQRIQPLRLLLAADENYPQRHSVRFRDRF